MENELTKKNEKKEQLKAGVVFTWENVLRPLLVGYAIGSIIGDFIVWLASKFGED